VVVEPKQNQRKSATKNTWGGRRPGAGARKGNLNALKPCPEPAARRSRRDGRFSRYQQAFIEALMQVPQTRETMIAIRKRQRAQPVLSRGGSPRVEGIRRAAAGAPKGNPNGTVAHGNNQGQNNQELLGLPNTEYPGERKNLPKTIKSQPTSINPSALPHVL
jgi:hypothetical protein